MSDEEKKNAALQEQSDKAPSPSAEEKGIDEIESMQAELEAMLKRMDKMDPVQMLKDTMMAMQPSSKMNADLPMFEGEGEDADQESSDDDEDIPAYQGITAS